MDKVDKILVVLGACGIHACIGSVYAWSVLVHPIIEQTGWGLSSVTFAFSLAILFLGMSAGLLGRKVHKWGAKKSALISCAFFVTGLLGSALALHLESIALLYVSYGAIGGIGLGVGYISPVATLLKWFPEHKGFAGGCAVMSFGFAALVAGPLMSYLTTTYGLEQNFVIVAALYGVIMFASSMLLKQPPKQENKYSEKEKKWYGECMNMPEAVHTPEFQLLWIMFFVNIACGIALLSIASPMAQKLGASAVDAATLVGTLGIVNGSGRLVSATMSDIIGRPISYILFFLIQVAAFGVLAMTRDYNLFFLAIIAVVFCYGGGFSCMPAYLSDLFGVRHLSAIHGAMLTAWGVAGIFGPLFLSFALEQTGNYKATMEFFIALFVVNTMAAVKLKNSLRLARQRKIMESVPYWDK